VVDKHVMIWLVEVVVLHQGLRAIEILRWKLLLVIGTSSVIVGILNIVLLLILLPDVSFVVLVHLK